MDTNAVTTLISSMGFPIAMCLLLAWYVYNKDKTHKAEIDKLSDAVNKQTLSIQRLVERIDRMLGGDKK